ncbi:MAG: class C sortase [Oscillospiraceae bacterium]
MPLIIIGIVFALGISVLLYPVISTFISTITSTVTVQSYQKTVKTIDADKRNAIISAAHTYNAEFSGEPKNEEYESLLNIDGIMGYLDIPCIEICLPIYHGVTEEVLQNGVGHLPKTSLPVGGRGTHAVLSAHCGLPNAHLFTDLDQMKDGDCFFIHVLEETMAYRVNQIKIVRPEEVNELSKTADEDCVTLLTCTPYGINSHRLLVRGIRIPYVPKSDADTPEDLPEQSQSTFCWMWISGVLSGLVLLLLLLLKRREKQHK